MNKILMVALLALAAGFSFAQESTFKIGARAGFNLHNVFWNGKPPGIGMGYGGGIAAVFPITGSLAFNPELNFYRRNVYNHELSKDTLMTVTMPGGGQSVEALGNMTIKEKMTEFAVGIPLLLQFTPISNVPFYVIGGMLFTIPIKSKLKCELSLDGNALDNIPDPVKNMIPENVRNNLSDMNNMIPADMKSKTMDFKNRSKVDVGVMLGSGYYITKNFAVDIRGSVDLTDISSKKNDRNPPYNPFRHDKTWLIQYGLGLSYFI